MTCHRRKPYNLLQTQNPRPTTNTKPTTCHKHKAYDLPQTQSPRTVINPDIPQASYDMDIRTSINGQADTGSPLSILFFLLKKRNLAGWTSLCNGIAQMEAIAHCLGNIPVAVHCHVAQLCTGCVVKSQVLPCLQ